ncbi:MAG: nucleotidyltransferase domain-containing protein [Candidatus Parvarchaeota archaeon]|nr:nucleotidyltransferase domain-containing protein [Candidatus Rehaiarchaeum fermentans]
MNEYEIKGYDVAYKFSTKLFSLYPKYIKSIVLFGSYAKELETKESDIDILVIVDDLSNNNNVSLGAFNVDIEKLRSEIKEINIHVNVISLSGLWEGFIKVDPFVINAVRFGYPLIDTGFFEPMKLLLLKGLIKPTKEAIYAGLSRSDILIGLIEKEKFTIIYDLYWSLINSAQALIMQSGKLPPSPEEIPKELKDAGVPDSIISIFQELHEIYKSLEHKTGKVEFPDIDKLINKANEFNNFVKSKIS